MKVYGICENKEHVELPQMFGICEVTTFEDDGTHVLMPSLPKTNMRHIIKNYAGVAYNATSNDFPDNYNLQIVYKRKFSKTATPAGMVRVHVNDKNILKYIDNINLSDYDVVHFNIFWDGLNLCCKCDGYVE